MVRVNICIGPLLLIGVSKTKVVAILWWKIKQCRLQRPRPGKLRHTQDQCFILMQLITVPCVFVACKWEAISIAVPFKKNFPHSSVTSSMFRLNGKWSISGELISDSNNKWNNIGLVVLDSEWDVYVTHKPTGPGNLLIRRYHGIPRGTQRAERNPYHSPPSSYWYNDLWSHVSVPGLRLHAMLSRYKGKSAFSA
jgi:hypothetical protein